MQDRSRSRRWFSGEQQVPGSVHELLLLLGHRAVDVPHRALVVRRIDELVMRELPVLPVDVDLESVST